MTVAGVGVGVAPAAEAGGRGPVSRACCGRGSVGRLSARASSVRYATGEPEERGVANLPVRSTNIPSLGPLKQPSSTR